MATGEEEMESILLGQAIRDSTLSSVFVRVLSLLLLCRRGLKEVGVSLNLVLGEGALKTKH